MNERDSPAASQRSAAGGDPGLAETALLDVGAHDFVTAARGLADDFAAGRELEIATLREDAEGDFRQGGILRILGLLILVPSVFPLFGQVHYRLAGGGFEVYGMVASGICAVMMGFVVGLSRGRPFDKHTLGIYQWVAFSCAAGAAIAWWNGMAGTLLWTFCIAAGIVVLLLSVLQIVRWRDLEVGRLRDEDAMDRSAALRQALAAELRNSATTDASLARANASERMGEFGSEEEPDDVVEAFLDELQERTVPKPRQRTFADPANRHAG